MSLGPKFVRLHLPQLLVLWRNALPKPTSKDTTLAQTRSEGEWRFLLHVRECTLGAILAFLRHNVTKLVTIDVARRLVALLANSLGFANGFASHHTQALLDQTPSTTSSLTLLDRDNLLRRRIFQCFVALGPTAATSASHPALLTATLSTFADPEGYIGGNLQAGIAAQASVFGSVWEGVDGYGYGVTGLMRGGDSGVAIGEGEKGLGSSGSHWLNRDTIEVEIEAQVRIIHP